MGGVGDQAYENQADNPWWKNPKTQLLPNWINITPPKNTHAPTHTRTYTHTHTTHNNIKISITHHP
jgi:hypothetical protein